MKSAEQRADRKEMVDLVARILHRWAGNHASVAGACEDCGGAAGEVVGVLLRYLKGRKP